MSSSSVLATVWMLIPTCHVKHMILSVQDIPLPSRTLLESNRGQLRQIYDNTFHVLLQTRLRRLPAIMCSPGSLRYGRHIGLSRCSSLRLHPRRAKSGARQRGRPGVRIHGRTEMSLTRWSAENQHPICRLEDYERRCCCCPCKPAAQPSSCDAAASWPHGGATCAYRRHTRLCNAGVTANHEWTLLVGWFLLLDNDSSAYKQHRFIYYSIIDCRP